MTKTNQKIPEGWSIKKLADCCSMSSGGTPSKNNSDFWNGDIPWISASAMRGIFFSSSEEKITELGLQKGSHSVNKGDLLLLVRGSMLWNCIPIGIATRKLAFNQDVKGISVKNNITNQFLLYWFKTNEHFIKNMVVGTGIGAGKLDTQELNNIKILLPPLAEQEKIVEILSCWDEGIEKLSALIEKKKIQKKALMQKLLNFQRDYLKRFDEIFEDYSDKHHPNKDLLSATQENGVIPRRLLKGRVMSPEGSLDGYKLVQPGNFVISLRSFQGGFEYSYHEGIISPAYTVLKNKIEINRYFYKYFFKSYNFIEKYLSIAVIGIRDGKQISYSDLQSVKIPYPLLPEQKAIADILSKADEEIELLNKKLEAFKLEKKALMQKLLTGQIRVKVN